MSVEVSGRSSHGNLGVCAPRLVEDLDGLYKGGHRQSGLDPGIDHRKEKSTSELKY